MPEYEPCSRCGAKWNESRSRWFHRPGCDLTKVAIQQATKPLPESIHILIDRFAMEYHQAMILKDSLAHVDAVHKALVIVQQTRTALNAAISAHRLS